MEVDLAVWSVGLAASMGAVAALGWWARGARDRAQRRRWPERWNLNPRPIFNVHERALYRDLRAALPQHIVLSKVSLLRFCHSAQASDARAWYDRLQALHVSLVVCTPNGGVITAIDIDANGDDKSRRAQRLKEGVLEACRVRYIRCRPGQWPQASLMAAWALGQHPGEPASTPMPATAGNPLNHVGDQLTSKLRQRRAERAARWAESSFAPDSFFAFDSRVDEALSEPAPLSNTEAPPRGA